jgi:threonine aldolase
MAHYQFASDNTAPICPEALQALNEANTGFCASYGHDNWTQQAANAIRASFETDCEVFFVFNGTSANALSLAALCQSYHSVICHELAHIETDECGAPEFFSNGTKLLLGSGAHGKLVPEEITRLVTRRSDIHYPKPRVVSLTQCTELGTVYTPDELSALQAEASRHNLHLHMDGARFGNACASLGATPAELSWKVGIEVLSLGGTKMGMPMGEAIVFFNKALASDFGYRCKQAGQLASKMRFLAAPWLGMLDNDTWLRHANHANNMAKLLADGLAALPGVTLMLEPQANTVFAQLPEAMLGRLSSRGWIFYRFIGNGGVRLVCSWATSHNDVSTFLSSAAGND